MQRVGACSLPLLVAFAAGVSAQQPSGPREVVRQALAAVEGDSVERVRARWVRAASQPPRDRMAMLGLASIARLTYAYDAADVLLDSLSTGEEGRPDAITAHARLAQSQAARSRGAMQDAERYAALALRAAEHLRDDDLTAEAILMLASARLRTKGPAAADSLFQRVQPRVLDDRLAALWHCGRAEMYALTFRPASAEAAAGAARAQKANDGRMHAQCQHMIAADTARRGFVPEAIQLFTQVAEERRRLRDGSGLASTLQWTGAQNRIQGHLESAFRSFQESIQAGRASRNESAMAWSYAGLAAIESQLGDAPASASYADSATALFAKQGDRYGQALVLEGRAVISLLVGALPRARDEYARVVSLYEQLGFGQGMYTAQLGLVNVALAERDYARADRELRVARGIAQRFGQQAFVQGNQYFEGLVAMRLGRMNEARGMFEAQLRQVQREARETPQGAQPHWEYYDGMRLAELHARLGNLDRASVMALDASEALDRWRGTLSRRELRLRALQMTETAHDTDMGLSTVVSRLVLANRLDTAFTLVERLHSRELLDHLVRAEGLRTGASIAAPDTAVLSPGLAQVMSRPGIALALPESTALLEYLIGRDGAPSTVFVLTRDTLRAHTMALPDSLARDIERFTTLIEGRATPRDLASALSRAVLDPAVSLLPSHVSRLLIVPDGALHRLAFDALLMPDGRFAVERFTIATLPSGSIGARLRRQRPTEREVRVLAVGDPSAARVVQQDASPQATNAGGRAAAAALHDLPRLRASRGEARAVARYGRRSVALVGDDASESRLKAMPLTDYRLLHFATHARVDEATLSGTALALGPGNGEDGLLGPGELSAFVLDADLVTLSACRSGGGAVVRGEGIVGLAAPLIGAGARAIALTRWPIGDEATPRFIQEFYEALSAGTAAGDALRSAKLAAMRRGAPPAEWAAFTIVGDPMVRIPLGSQVRSSWRLPLIAVGLMLLCGAVLAARRRRQL